MTRTDQMYVAAHVSWLKTKKLFLTVARPLRILTAFRMSRRELDRLCVVKSIYLDNLYWRAMNV